MKEEIKLEELNWNKKFTDKDNVWIDSTDIWASSKRKDGFKVFTNYFIGMILHYFPCYEHEGITYYHVIEEYIERKESKILPDTRYYLLSKKEIQENYGSEII
jgi:hypothetical protein